MSEIKLSATALTHLARCPYAYKLYKEEKEQPSSEATSAGKAFHRLVELILNGDDYETALGKILIEFGDTDVKSIKAFYEVYKTEIERMKNIGVIATEKHFELPINKNLTIHGYIDIITADNKMIDMKTTAFETKSPKPAHVFQLSLYWLYEDKTTPELHYITPKTLNKFKVEPMPIRHIIQLVNQAQSIIENGQYPALGVITGYCPYCLFRNKCEFYTGGKQ